MKWLNLLDFFQKREGKEGERLRVAGEKVRKGRDCEKVHYL